LSERPLLDWLERRKESSVIVKARQHVGKVLDTAVDLDRALGFMLSGHKDEIPEALKRVEFDEKAADNLEVSIFEELSRGDMDPKEREDLMRLVRRIDDIADWYKVAGRNLELIVETGEEVPESLWGALKEMTKNSVDCCRFLKITIDAVGRNREEAMKARLEADRYEHIVDDLYFGVKKMMIKEVVDAKAVVVLNDLLVGIENATDSIKASADQAYILVMGSR
jgi:predicted phosphate transport protein (TIGR00153 family)